MSRLNAFQNSLKVSGWLLFELIPLEQIHLPYYFTTLFIYCKVYVEKKNGPLKT